MRPPLRVGVVGLGVISRFYLRALERSPSMRLVAVCDRDPAVLAAHTGRAAGYTDHLRLLEEAGVDAVVVTAPNDVHAGVCTDALERGVAVCVEKPLALNVAEGEALTALARRRGTALFTAFHRRYNAAVARLRAALVDERVEELTVRYLERIEEHAGTDTWYLDASRCGGGCVADNGPNAFDLVDLLLGPADAVSARIVRDAAGTDRRADIALRASGARARVLLDWSYDGERKDVEARLVDGRTLTADMLAGHPGFKDSLWHEYAGILEAFERCVRDGSREGAGGLAALALVADAYRLEEPIVEEVAG